MPDADGMLQLVQRHVLTAGTPLQGQAYDIIASIFDDPCPELDEVKHRLQRCLAAYPHAPERALLAHLMETSRIANAEGGGLPVEGLPVA
jgi:hypothetical protein